MDISTIKQKIAALEAEIVPNSVSPERVASILSDITSLVENIGYLGYEFLGVATPAASPSFDKDLTSKKYFYIAVQQGTYTNFGGLAVGANDGLTILAYNGTWTKMATGTAMKTDIKNVLRTGDVRNSLIGNETDRPVSVALVKSLYSNGYTFMGIADTETAPYSKPDVIGLKLFYIAVEKGTYMKFGNKEKKSAASLMVLMSSDSGKTWTSEESADLSADISDLAARVSIGKAPVWISVEADTVGDVSTYDVGTVIWRKDRNTLCEVALDDGGRKVAGADHSIEEDRIYVYGGNLCKWNGTKFVPFYQEEKEKRYLFSLDSIDSLTTATDSETVYQSFIPAGETVYKLPTTGDLLGDEENNIYADILYAHCTEAMDEGGITLSYYKDGVVKTIRITGDDYEWGTWKVAEVTTVKLKYKYNLQKIFALSSSSGTEDIVEAFTPTYAPDGNTAMRLPQSGDLLEATNGATSVVLKGLSKSFSFFYGKNRRDITLSGSAGNYKVAVVATPLDVRVFDLDKLNALTDESTPEDIEEALGGTPPTVGDLLRGADESSWVIMSGSEMSILGHTFTYHTGGKLRTLTVSGGQGNETIKVEEKEVESDGALRITTSKISVLVSGGTASCDLGVTYQQLQDAIADNQLIMGDINGELYAAVDGNSNVTLMSVAFLSGKWHSVIIAIPSYSGTTASVTVTMKPLMDFVTIPYSFLSGEIGGVFDRVKMPDLLSANIIITDKGIATLDVTSGYVLSLLVDGKDYVRCTIDYSDNGGLKLTARTVIPNTGIFALPIGARDMADEAKAVDIGIPLDDLADLIENGVIRAVSATDGSILTASASTVSGARRVVLILATTTPFISNGNVFIECGIGFHITDAGSGKVDITKIADLAKAPCVDETGKLPAEVLPEQEPHVEFSLQLHNGDLLMICKEGEIRPSDEIHFYRRGRYCTRSMDKVSEDYVAFNKKDGWRTNGQNNRDGNYETYIPMKFGKEKLEQGVDGNPKLVGMDVWKLTAIENQSGFADPFPALFRSAMVRLRYPNDRDSWDVYIRDGRDGKKYGWEDFQKLSQTGEIRKTVQAGVAVHRNWKRISGIVPFKIRFHLINDGTLSEEVPPTIDDNYVRVTLRI